MGHDERDLSKGGMWCQGKLEVRWEGEGESSGRTLSLEGWGGVSQANGKRENRPDRSNRKKREGRLRKPSSVKKYVSILCSGHSHIF